MGRIVHLVATSENKHKVYCSLCKREFSIAHGESNDCKQHTQTAGHKNNERDVNQLSKINCFFSNTTTSASNMLAGELSLVYHTVKHSVSYNSMDYGNYGNKLTKEIFRDSEMANKLLCSRTKAEAIVKNFLTPKSVKYFVDILSNEDNARKFFSLATDASNYKNLVVRYFDSCEGIQNKLLDFIEQSDETASSIYKLLKQSVEQNGLNLRNASSYCTDNAFVNY
ncbi:hypothetical protein PR048_014513, partial [Dryococelus australis]